MHTIFAQCSAHGKAGVTVFRISGPSALYALAQIIDRDTGKLEPRKMYYHKIYNPKTHYLIDTAMVVFFTGNASFTGEDSVEIHTHGSIAIIKMMHTVLASITGLRLAEPGEFARRAFLNGKMDLTAAEGLADLIEAETELQHQQAIAQLQGNLRKIYDQLRLDLINIISLIEAYIDFPEEEIPLTVTAQITFLVEQLQQQIKTHINDDHRGERLRHGIKLVILGKPNVGKSSLLNVLVQREIAIVSDIAGTTRDIIEGHLNIGGYPIILQDTAGIRTISSDIIEQEGISRAKLAAQSADIKIIIFDITQKDHLNINDILYQLIDHNTIVLFNKIDLAEVIPPDQVGGTPTIAISIKRHQGIDQVMSAIINIAKRLASPSSTAPITQVRHRIHLEQALEYLDSFSLQDELVLAAEDLRMTMRAISCITGKVTVDDILNQIFSTFCIGK